MTRPSATRWSPAPGSFARRVGLVRSIEAVCREHRYSRYPVTRGGEDDIVGILHVKDLFDVTDAEEATFDLARYLRPAVFVPELKRAEGLFREMRRRRFHMAIVVDESGSVAGLVTLEDLVEQIVGDIFDEHDEPARRPETEGTALLTEGAYPLASLERDLGVLVRRHRSRDGGRVPSPPLRTHSARGSRTRVEGVEFVVERASPRAIERVRDPETGAIRGRGGSADPKAPAP